LILSDQLVDRVIGGVIGMCSAAMGRRGWRMFCVTLCDMVLYLHKDDRSFRQTPETAFGTPTNAVRVHHALATRATDYIKKQHVFRLCTADWSQTLFQARSDTQRLHVTTTQSNQ